MKQNMVEMENERGISIETLVISGGGSYSDLCMQIFADVFGIPVVRNEVRNAAGLGAAICVAVACDLYPSFDDASGHMVHREDRFEPNPDNADLYTQLRAVSVDITTQTDAILQRTHRILHDRKEAIAHA